MLSEADLLAAVQREPAGVEEKIRRLRVLSGEAGMTAGKRKHKGVHLNYPGKYKELGRWRVRFKHGDKWVHQPQQPTPF